MNPTDLKINDQVYFYEPGARTVRQGTIQALRATDYSDDPFSEDDTVAPTDINLEIRYESDGRRQTAYKSVPINEPLNSWVHPDRDRVIDYAIAQAELVIANVTALKAAKP